LLPKRQIKAIEVVADIRAGLTDTDLMDKYRLSSKGLQSIFKKLMDGDVLSASELEARVPVFDDTAALDYIRLSPKQELVCLVPVYEASSPDVIGTVCDLTEKSVAVTGIGARVDQEKTLVIPADEFFRIEPFSFDAVCRWVRQGPSSTVVGAFGGL